MVTSLSIESPHTFQMLGFTEIQFSTWFVTTFAVLNSSYVRQRTLEGFFLDSLLFRYAHTLCQTAWSTFESDVASGFSFPVSGVLAVSRRFLSTGQGSWFGAAPYFRSDARFAWTYLIVSCVWPCILTSGAGVLLSTWDSSFLAII